jgi:hypothetical protein
MIITSSSDELSPVLTISIFDSSNPSTTDLNMQGLSFGEMDQGHASSTYTEPNRPQSRRPNKLQKMSNFISDYGERRTLSQQVSLLDIKRPTFINKSILAHPNDQSIKQHSALLSDLKHI